MAMSSHEHFELSRDKEKTLKEIVAGGSLSSAIFGVGAGVLAILALVGIYPMLFAAIATILVGVAFLVEGGVIVSQISHLTLEPATRRETEAIGQGMAMESLAGIAGIVLGILALIGINPMTLLAVSAIVYGCGVLMESGAMARLNILILSGSHLENQSQSLAYETLNATAGLDTICGFAGIVLGILALAGISPLGLILVSMLAFGCVQLLSGTALTSKVLTVFSH